MQSAVGWRCDNILRIRGIFPLFGIGQSLIFCTYSGIIKTSPLLILCPKYSTSDLNSLVLQGCILIPAATCAHTTWTKCQKWAQGSPLKVRISSRYDLQKSLSFMATSSILLYTLPVLANPNGFGMYWNVPNGLLNAVHAGLPGLILTAW